MSAPAWDLRIDLPDQWFMLPMGRRRRWRRGGAPDLDDLERQLDARIEREPDLAAARADLRTMLLEFTDGAASRGAASAAFRWALDGLDDVSTATLDTYLMSREPGPVDAAIAELRAGLSERQATDRDDPLVEVRTLRAGDAVRVQVITETAPEPSAAGSRRAAAASPEGVLLVEMVQYWLPVAGQEDLVLLVFSTPNLAGAEQLVAELDATVSTMELIT